MILTIMAEKKPIITLLTDFGGQDYFVGAMKGAILKIVSNVDIVDIAHDIPAHDILQAAFMLKNYYRYFPAGTIHVAVVDPGVGTARRPLLAVSESGIFVVPDNGILSYVSAGQERCELREITADHYFLKPRAGTFDGRDVFAPVAAWLAKGVSPSSFGDVISDEIRFDISQPLAVQEHLWKCKILYVDRFGNLTSNLSKEFFEKLLDASEKNRFAFRIGDHTISKVSRNYAEAKEDGEILALFGSSGLLEFSVNQGSAAKALKVRAGQDCLLKVV
ncbi:hypothetical protein CSB45_00420 [candidate division KSB3 bacterium]|uniref:S-adenosyl-l-methionine hydroxide adenosyltransferase n=1 Tax=candidate division KSB3 bacterium TaxID=2044937 RepID=A0A2G6EDX0_9BACT|nr:MAG: hypothetical protein CSB45_00420 [candidate division KSB3 bacterium]